MAKSDTTQIGGDKDAFSVTSWAVIEEARSADRRRKIAAVGLILQRYWKPVYAYLRRWGCDNERAKDITQGFFADLIASRTQS